MQHTGAHGFPYAGGSRLDSLFQFLVREELLAGSDGVVDRILARFCKSKGRDFTGVVKINLDSFRDGKLLLFLYPLFRDGSVQSLDSLFGRDFQSADLLHGFFGVDSRVQSGQSLFYVGLFRNDGLKIGWHGIIGVKHSSTS